MQQSAVSDVMSCLSELPDRGKDPGSTVRLAEMFRTKEYFAEIKSALKKGYSFGDLAAIFTERCGVSISERQLKYHYTRERNKRAKNNSGKIGGKSKKSKRPDTSKGDTASDNSERTDLGDGAEGDTEHTEAVANVSANYATQPAAFVTVSGVTIPAETGAFSFEKRLRGK
jgi:hypothetical protein